jgi:peptidyl-prolyl cis-trans isomerase SurA
MKAVSAVVLVAALVAPAQGEIIEQVLVKVNGDIITKTDLENRQIAALREKMRAQVNPEDLKTDEGLKKALAEVTPQLLVETIDEMLLVQLGKEKGYRLTDEQFKSWLEDLRKRENLQDEAKWQQVLQQEGMTIEGLRQNVERNMLIQRVQQDEVGSKLQITEEEARQYYLAHKEAFAQPATVMLREILVEVPTTNQQGVAGVNVGADEEAKQQAAALRARVQAGEDFSKLAADVSAAPSKANGGLIGPLNVAELSPALQDLITKLKPGDVTEPLRVPNGYQLLQLETLNPAAIQPFETVRDLVADRVHEERQRTEVRKFLNRIRSQALIEWKNAELKKAYDQYLAASAAAPATGLDQ